MRNTLIPILVAICLFITGVAILNIQLWYSAKAEYRRERDMPPTISIIYLKKRHKATQTAVNIAGKECNLEEQYQLGTEAALKPHLRTIIILKQGIVWCTSLPGNRVLLSRIPVFPDSNLLLAPAIDTVNRLPILLYQNQFADTRILVTISDQHIRGALNVPLKG